MSNASAVGWADQTPGAARCAGTPAHLLELARRLAAAAGTWELIGSMDVEERRYHLLLRGLEVEAWLIAWPTGGHLELHDHGVSSGAFWVVEGELEELYAQGGHDGLSFGRRRHRVADGAAFGSGYVHDVRNDSDTAALSVHVYSPPLESMTYFRQEGAGVVPARVEHRTGPTWEH